MLITLIFLLFKTINYPYIVIFIKLKKKLMLQFLDLLMFLVQVCQKMIIEFFQDFLIQSREISLLQFLKTENKLELSAM